MLDRCGFTADVDAGVGVCVEFNAAVDHEAYDGVCADGRVKVDMVMMLMLLLALMLMLSCR